VAALREILAEFGIKFDQVAVERADQGVEGLVGRVKQLGSVLLGGAVVAGIKNFVLGLANEADSLRDQAIALGLSVGELQGWRHAAALSGVEADALTQAIARVQRGSADAAKGTGPAADAFRTLGVSATDASGRLKGPSELLNEVGAAIGAINDPTRRTALAMDVFGRSGARLIPLFTEGREGMARMRAEVEALGGGFSKDFAEAADEVNDELLRLNLLATSAKVRIAQALLPAVRGVVQTTIDWGRRLLPVLERSKALDAGLTVLAAGGIVKTLGAVLKLTGGIRGLFALILRFGLRILLPFLLLEDLFVFLSGGDSLVGRALDRIFGPGTQEKVRKFIDDVKGAVVSFFGDLIERPQKFVEDIELLFETLGRDIRSLFGGLGDRVRSFFDGVATKADEIFGGSVAAVIRGFGDLVGGVIDFVGEHFGGVVQAMGFGMLLAVDMMTGGWENFSKKLEAIGTALSLPFMLAWESIRSSALIAAASIQDAFANLWNGVLMRGHNALLGIGGALAKVPGMKELAGDVIVGAAKLTAGLASVENTKQARVEAAGRFGAIAETSRRAAAELETRRGFGAPVTVNTTVNVPAGTPGEVAQRVGKAAERGATRGAGLNLGAARAALVHTVD
jgi:hypothetical protein